MTIETKKQSIVKPSKTSKITIEMRRPSSVKEQKGKTEKVKQWIETLKPLFPNFSESHIENLSIVLYFLYLTIEKIDIIDIVELIETIDSFDIKNRILLSSLEPTTISQIAKRLEIENVSKIANHIKGEKTTEGLLELKMIELVNEDKKQYQITKQGEELIINKFKDLIERKNQKEEEERYVKEEEESISDLIEKFKEFIENETKSQENKTICINFKKLVRFNHHSAEYLLDNPLECLKIIKVAIEDIFDKPHTFEVINIPDTELLKIGEIRSLHLNKLKKIRGTVSSLSDVKPQITETKFECPQCGNIITILQKESRLKEPTKCGCGRKGKFRLVDKSLVDVQKMILEELSEELDGRSESRKLKVILKDNLTEYNWQPQFESSNKLELTGVLIETDTEKKGTKQTEMDILFEVSSINTEGWKELKITPTEKENIIAISKKETLMKELVDNIAPHIAGLRFEKLGMLISIVSGGDPTKVTKGKRDDVHLLYVGDPSVGKSQIMQFGHEIYPKSRWVSGNSTTGVGLIGSVINDDFMNQPTVSKGALALANHHVVFLDELDKMRDTDKDALHNAMEDQFAAIDKWNKHTKFQTDTTLIAAMNPIKSKFNDEKQIYQQIELAQTIKDRFDLIFVIRDRIDEVKDLKLVEKILEEHNKESEGTIDQDLFMKYIDYARLFRPILSIKSQEIIKKEYIILRKQYTTIMTPRQLKAMVRITLAITKLRLSNESSEKDTKIALDLVRYCLSQQGILDQQIQPLFEELEMIEEEHTLTYHITKLLDKQEEYKIQDIVVGCEKYGHKTQDIEQCIHSGITKGSWYEIRPGTLKGL